MRRTMPNMQPFATVADVCGVSPFPPTRAVMEDKRKALTIHSLSLKDAATAISNAYQTRVTVEQIEADIAAGAPTNADGTISAVAYVAWLLQETRRAT